MSQSREVSFNIEKFINLSDGVVIDNVSPIIQKNIGSEFMKDIVISGKFRTTYDGSEKNGITSYSYIQVRKNTESNG